MKGSWSWAGVEGVVVLVVGGGVNVMVVRDQKGRSRGRIGCRNGRKNGSGQWKMGRRREIKIAMRQQTPDEKMIS